jgi:hypothetical protein
MSGTNAQWSEAFSGNLRTAVIESMQSVQPIQTMAERVMPSEVGVLWNELQRLARERSRAAEENETLKGCLQQSKLEIRKLHEKLSSKLREEMAMSPGQTSEEEARKAIERVVDDLTTGRVPMKDVDRLGDAVSKAKRDNSAARAIRASYRR